MNLTPRDIDTNIRTQHYILRNTQDLQNKTGGATIRKEDFADVAETTDSGNTLIPAGTAIGFDEDGFAQPYADGEGLTGASLTVSDLLIFNAQATVGAYTACHPLESRCHGVTEEFKEATKGRIVFDI